MDKQKDFKVIKGVLKKYVGADVDVIVPSNVKEIGYAAFEGKELLKNIVIPEGVTKICLSAFENCVSLISISIPNSVTIIEDYAFLGCSSLTYNIKEGIKYLGNNDNPHLYLVGLENENITHITVADNCRFIGTEAFYDCTTLKSVNIPDSVTNIGGSAFSGCKNLENIIIPKNVSIESGAFSGCHSLVNNLDLVEEFGDCFCDEDYEDEE